MAPRNIKKKKVLFITTSNLSTNPRLLKEVCFLEKEGFECEILAFKLGNWYDENDQKIILEYNLNVKLLAAHRGVFFPWLFASLAQFIIRQSWQRSFPVALSAIASNKRSLLLLSELRKRKDRYDLLIAHNLGALYPSYHFADKWKIPMGFDVEDYHPGEIIEGHSLPEFERRVILMKTLLPKCAFVSFASPLIGVQTRRLVSLKEERCLDISNAFFSSEFVSPQGSSYSKISFVWFSQHITYGRGLELFLKAADAFSTQLEVTIIGVQEQSFFEQEIKHRHFVSVKNPLTQEVLHQTLSSFDVGLAIEISNIDVNKDICISNKIFAYAQAGLFILATNTAGQTHFLTKNEEFGFLIGQQVPNFIDGIKQIIEQKGIIRANADKRYRKAKTFSYEHEAKKLLVQIENI